MFNLLAQQKQTLIKSLILFANTLGLVFLYCNDSLLSQPNKPPVPNTDPSSGSTGNSSRGDCLVVPLLPERGNYTASENPAIWLYVGLLEDSNSASEYQISSEYSDFTIFKTIKQLQLIRKEEFPKLIKFNLPVQDSTINNNKPSQVLLLNQKYSVTFRCQVSDNKNDSFGNSLSIERKLIDKNMASLSFRKMFDLFQKSNLGIDATSLLFSKKSCSNSKDANELFDIMVRKQISVDKTYQSKFIPEASTAYNKYLYKMCRDNQGLPRITN